MADWTPPPYLALVAGKAITDAKFQGAYENLIAFAEQSDGTPKMAQINTLSGVAAQTQTFLGLGDFEGLEFVGAFNAAISTVQSFTVEFSTDGGTSWSTPVNWLTHVTANQIYTLSGAIDFATAALVAVGYGTVTGIVRPTPATITGMSLDVDAVRFSSTVPQLTQAMLIRPKGRTA